MSLNRTEEIFPAESFMQYCTTLNWDELKSFLSSDTKYLSLKILVTALIEANHPDKDERNDYGMSVWDDKLSNISVTPDLSLLCNRVDLSDFYIAYCAADWVLYGSNIDPEPLKEIIREYVILHKINLAEILNEKDNLFSKDIFKIFGDLTITDHDRRTFDVYSEVAKSAFERKKMKSQELQLLIAMNLDEIFDFPIGTCKLSADYNLLKSYTTEAEDKLFKQAKGTFFHNQLNHLKAFDEVRIDFDKKITAETVKECAEKLEKLGLRISYVCYRNRHGQQLFIKACTPLKEMLWILNDALTAKSQNQHEDKKRKCMSPS